MTSNVNFEYKAAYYHLLLQLQYPGQHSDFKIKETFRQMVLKLHPDKGLWCKDEDGVETTEELKEARDFLLCTKRGYVDMAEETRFKDKYNRKMQILHDSLNARIDRRRLQFKPLRLLEDQTIKRKRCIECRKMAQMVCLHCTQKTGEITVFCNKQNGSCLMKHICNKH